MSRASRGFILRTPTPRHKAPGEGPRSCSASNGAEPPETTRNYCLCRLVHLMDIGFLGAHVAESVARSTKDGSTPSYRLRYFTLWGIDKHRGGHHKRHPQLTFRARGLAWERERSVTARCGPGSRAISNLQLLGMMRQNATTPTSKSRSACPGPVVFLLTRSYKGKKFGGLLRVHLEPIGDVDKPSRQRRKGHLKETYGRVCMDEMYHFSVY